MSPELPIRRLMKFLLTMKFCFPIGAPDSPYCMEYTVAGDDISNPPSGRSSPELPIHRASGAKLMFSTTKVGQILYDPCHEKTCLQGFGLGKTQTDLLSYRDWLGSWHF